MNKQEFLAELEKGLQGLPEADRTERLAFYGEMIDDRMEEGVGEEEAVSGIGPVSEVIGQIIAETPVMKLVKEKVKPKRRLSAAEIIFLIVGFPLWFTFLVVFFVLILVLYLVLWVLVAALWVVWLVLGIMSFAALAASVVYFILGYRLLAFLFLAAAFVAAGFSILLFFGCKYATKGTAILAKKIGIGIKRLFVRKERTK